MAPALDAGHGIGNDKFYVVLGELGLNLFDCERTGEVDIGNCSGIDADPLQRFGGISESVEVFKETVGIDVVEVRSKAIDDEPRDRANFSIDWLQVVTAIIGIGHHHGSRGHV